MLSIGALRGALTGPWVSNELWKNARAVPSLDLRFADNKSLIDAKTNASLVTFTRASSGTYVGSDGLIKSATTNEARFDHNPITGESLGLLMEEARTNLAIYSEQFNDASWTKTSSTIAANTVISPDGLTTGDSITSSAGLLGRVEQTISQTTGTTYTLSTFAKANQYTFCQLRITGTVVGAITRAYFDLTTGTITGAANCTASITPAGNGWYRCSITYTTILTAAATVRIYGQVDAADTVGDGTSGIYLWGAQMEAGAFPTSYIPTTTATVTRAADVASITGTNFSSWYNQTEGTVFAEFTPRTFAQACGLLSLDDGTTSERLQTRLSTAGNGSFLVADGGSVQANFSTTNSTVLNTKGKLATSFVLNSFQACLNGELVASDTLGTLPTVTQAVIGNAVGAFIFNGPISRLVYWPVRLANPTLQSISAP